MYIWLMFDQAGEYLIDVWSGWCIFDWWLIRQVGFLSPSDKNERETTGEDDEECGRDNPGYTQPVPTDNLNSKHSHLVI